MKNQKGISLIALIITIVILIILAGVTINLVLQNNGVLNKTEIAREDTLRETAKEKMYLKITNMQIERYSKEQRMPTLQEFADGLCEDGEIQYVELESKKIASLEKIEVGSATSIFTKLKEYPYEFEINSSLQLASIDGIKIANNELEKFKQIIAQAITNKGVITNQTDSAEKMAENISKIKSNPSEYSEYLNNIVYPNGMPLIPEMTSEECSVGKATSSTASKSNRVAYKAFDKKHYFGDIVKYNDIEDSWQTANNGENYIQFEFNKKVKVNRLEFIPSYTSGYGGLTLKTAKLLLSNDGENFIDASELVSFTNNVNSALTWNKIESNDKENYYKYVRLYVNGSYTSSYGTGIAIREMQIYGWFEE